MPDLDLIKQAKQGDAGVQKSQSRRALAGRRRLQPMRVACCRFAAEAANRISGISMNGCGQSKTGATRVRVCFSA